MTMEPTAEQINEWEQIAFATPGPMCTVVARLAYAAGAGAELVASCDAIYEHEGQPLCGGTAEWLRAARRSPALTPAEIKAKAIEILSCPRRVGECHVRMTDTRQQELLLAAVELIPIADD